MPYVIVTINPKGATEQDSIGHSFYVPTSSRRAVATLDEARWGTIEVIFAIEGDGGANIDFARALPESGGTITLPDGTLIEVERVARCDLACAAGISFDEYALIGEREVIDAFNARETAA